MEMEQPREQAAEAEAATAGQFSGEAAPDDGAAWEQIAAGRFMPRRIKGSYKGRALG